MNKSCSTCDEPFHCGADEPDKRCWCETYPAITPPVPDRDCECPRCLARTVRLRIEELTATRTTEHMVEIAAPYRDGELIEGIDYMIEDGNYVFSLWFHLRRGSCCGSGCRHCPYGNAPRGL